MTWTKVAPTVPGCYWIRPVRKPAEATVCKVISGPYDAERGLTVDIAGCQDTVWMNDFGAEPWLMEWAGPIPAAREPVVFDCAKGVHEWKRIPFSDQSARCVRCGEVSGK